MPSTEPSPVIHVAVGLLLDRGRVCITRRPSSAHQGGKWEFPGGKLADDEPVPAALRRELHEELGIEVESAAPYMQVHHAYADRDVFLDVWRITAWRGVPHGREGQEARWVAIRELPSLDFAEADWPILKRLWLPPFYLVSDATRLGGERFLVLLERALAAGARLVQLREPQMPEREYLALARAVAQRCHRHGARVLLNAEPAWAGGCGADGAHLNSRRLMALRERPLPLRFFVGASCHTAAELGQASRIGADLAVLSPVAKTASHPQAKPLGWEKFRALCAGADLPVYALGGMRPPDLASARQAGAQGIALSGGLWLSDDIEGAVRALTRA